MKSINFFALLVGLAAIAGIVWPTFFMPLATKEKPVVTVANAATAKGQEPWMQNERYNAPGRDGARKQTQEALDQPWSSFCTADGRKLLIDAINYYYGQRVAQTLSYANTYGEAARQYAIKAWTTADDSRVERKTREIFGRGYFKLDELRVPARGTVAELVKGERVSGKPCTA